MPVAATDGRDGSGTDAPPPTTSSTTDTHDVSSTTRPDADTERAPASSTSTSATTGSDATTTEGSARTITECFDLTAEIPPTSPDGVVVPIMVQSDVLIADLDVRIRIHHEDPSVLEVWLARGEDAPTPLVLGSHGCPPLAEALFIFDDEAQLDADAWCDAPGQAIAPESALSGHDGQSSAGLWRLLAIAAEGSTAGLVEHVCVDIVPTR